MFNSWHSQIYFYTLNESTTVVWQYVSDVGTIYFVCLFASIFSLHGMLSTVMSIHTIRNGYDKSRTYFPTHRVVI